MRRATIGWLVALGVASVCACSHPGQDPSHPVMGVNPDGSPAWVNRGSGAFEGPHGKAFYGVGIAQGIDNPSLLRQTAGNRARGEVAKIFDLYVAAMMRDYQRATTAGDFSASAEEQDVVSAQKTITEVTLRGVQVQDHWTNPADGSLFALAVLDLNAIEEGVGQAQLSPKLRDYVRDNARKAFEDLDRELAGRTERQAPSPPPAAPEQPTPPDPPPAETPAPAPAPAPAANQPVKVGLRITGIDRATVQTCFAERLINAGYQVFEGTSDVQVMIRGSLVYKKAGFVNNAHMVKAHANVRANDMNNGRTLVAVSERIKVGRPTVEQAIQLAVSRLCDRVVPTIVAKIGQGVR